MTSVSLASISKTYRGGVHAVRGVTLDIDDGEFVVLLGPSGCGKSTLLRMIAGLETITGGVLSIGGREVQDVHPRERDIAMVFQNYALYPHMSVRRNLAYPLKLKRVPRAEREVRVGKVAALLELNEVLDRKPGALSGGQRQRVAMGRALVREPQVFLMDEPLSNLDARLRIQMRSDITELQRRLAVTTLYVTHDQVEAMTMADRIVVLNAGEVQQIGTPAEIYEHPANLFVAAFIGSPPMNFLAATVDDGTLRLAGRVLATGVAATPAEGLEAIVAVRPEALRLVEVDSSPGESEVRLVGEVVSTELLGAETLLHVRVGAGVVRIVGAKPELTSPEDPHAVIVVRSAGNRSELAGHIVALGAGVDSFLPFDPASGNAILATDTPPVEPTGR